MAVSPAPRGMTFGRFSRDARTTQLVWYVGGAALGFLVPYLFSDVLGLRHDLYYAIYFALVGLFLTVYVRTTGVSILGTLSRSLALTLVVGMIIAGLEVMNVLRTSPSTVHPTGAYFGFELLWRGLLYGTVDALLLTAFPASVALGLFGGDLHSLARHLGFAAVALVLTIVITGTYHWGYAQYRQDGLRMPEQGNIIITLPTLIDANPIGSIVAHAAMHVTATAQSYETPVYLPPAVTTR